MAVALIKLTLRGNGLSTALDVPVLGSVGVKAQENSLRLISQFINAFNTIRGIALVSLHSVAADETQAVLQECCTLLLNAPVSRKLSQAERTAHLEACRAMVGTVCPLVAQLFRQVCAAHALCNSFVRREQQLSTPSLEHDRSAPYSCTVASRARLCYLFRCICI